MIDYTKLQQKLNPDPGGEAGLTLRTATVDAVNSDGTVDLEMSSGVIVPDVPRLASSAIAVGTVVQVISFRGSLLVIGPVAHSAAGAVPGRVATTVRIADSSSVSAETVADSVTAFLVQGTTYKVRWTAAVTASVAADSVFVRLREDNLAGTMMQIEQIYVPFTGGSGSRWPAHLEVEYTAVATGNKTFVGTYQLATGTGTAKVAALGTFPVYLYVDYARN